MKGATVSHGSATAVESPPLAFGYAIVAPPLHADTRTTHAGG